MSKDIDISFENIYNPMIKNSVENNKETENPQKKLINEPLSSSSSSSSSTNGLSIITIQPLCCDSICNFLFNLCCCCFLYD